MRVDVHSHFLPPRFLERMADLGAFELIESFSVYGPLLTKAAEQQFATGEEGFIAQWIQDMNACGVDRTVASIPLQPYFEDEQAGATAARFANGVLRDAVELGEGRVAAFGSLPLPHVGPTLKEIEFSLDECRFAGFSLGCSAADIPLDDPRFAEVWAALGERSAVIYLHPGTTPAMGVGARDFALAPMFGGPTEIALALCRLILSGVPNKHPQITFIAAVLGGTIPYLIRRYDDRVHDTNPGLYEEIGGVIGQLRRFWFDTSFEDTSAFDSVRRSYGADRLLLGSDAPRTSVVQAVESIQSSPFLTEAEKTQILDRNSDLAFDRVGGV